MTKIPETEHGGIDWATLEHRQKKHGAEISPMETRQAGLKAARVAQHPLDRLRARKSINARQWEAGDHLRKDYEASQGASSGGFDGMPNSTSPQSAGVTDAQINAAQLVANAYNAVGHDCMMLLKGLIESEMAVSEMAGPLGYSNRDQAMGALKLSLGKLADHYGIR